MFLQNVQNFTTHMGSQSPCAQLFLEGCMRAAIFQPKQVAMISIDLKLIISCILDELWIQLAGGRAVHGFS